MNALVAFEAAARHGHFGHAADELGVTHGAISKQVRHLEDILDLKLFDRKGARVQITNEGLRLLSSLSAAFDLIARARKDIMIGKARPVLRVSCETALASKWLVPRMSRFFEIHPDVEFHLLTSNETETVYDPDIDLSIRFGRPAWTDREVTHLGDLRLFPVCAPSFTENGKMITSTIDLQNRVLLHDESSLLWLQYLALNGVADFNFQGGHYFHDFHTLMAATRAGFGVALGDWLSCSEALNAGTLIRLLNDNATMQQAYYVVSAGASERSEICGAFVAWLDTQSKSLDVYSEP